MSATNVPNVPQCVGRMSASQNSIVVEVDLPEFRGASVNKIEVEAFEQDNHKSVCANKFADVAEHQESVQVEICGLELSGSYFIKARAYNKYGRGHRSSKSYMEPNGPWRPSFLAASDAELKEACNALDLQHAGNSRETLLKCILEKTHGVRDLRALCHKFSLSPSGSKADLIERLVVLGKAEPIGRRQVDGDDGSSNVVLPPSEPRQQPPAAAAAAAAAGAGGPQQQQKLPQALARAYSWEYELGQQGNYRAYQGGDLQEEIEGAYWKGTICFNGKNNLYTIDPVGGKQINNRGVERLVRRVPPISEEERPVKVQKTDSAAAVPDVAGTQDVPGSKAPQDKAPRQRDFKPSLKETTRTVQLKGLAQHWGIGKTAASQLALRWPTCSELALAKKGELSALRNDSQGVRMPKLKTLWELSKALKQRFALGGDGGGEGEGREEEEDDDDDDEEELDWRLPEEDGKVLQDEEEEEETEKSEEELLEGLKGLGYDRLKQQKPPVLRTMCTDRLIALPSTLCRSETCVRLLLEWKQEKLRQRAAQLRRQKSKEADADAAAEAYALEREANAAEDDAIEAQEAEVKAEENEGVKDEKEGEGDRLSGYILIALDAGHSDRESIIAHVEHASNGSCTRETIGPALRQELKKERPRWAYDNQTRMYTIAVGASARGQQPSSSQQPSPSSHMMSPEAPKTDAKDERTELEREMGVKSQSDMAKLKELLSQSEIDKKQYELMESLNRQGMEFCRIIEERAADLVKTLEVELKKAKSELKQVAEECESVKKQAGESQKKLDAALAGAKTTTGGAKTAAMQLEMNKPMKREQYAKHLKSLLGPKALEEQDVFHIIARANGGADHPDNYLFALGSGFNRSIGNKYDDLNCFLAGQAKTRKAVEVSMDRKFGGKGFGSFDPSQQGLSSSSIDDVARALYGRGQALMSHVRYAKKAQK